MSFKARSKRPSAEQAAKRLIILKLVVVYALMNPPRDMMGEIFQEWSQDEREKLIRR